MLCPKILCVHFSFLQSYETDAICYFSIYQKRRVRRRIKETLKVRSDFEWTKPKSAFLNFAVLPNVPEHKSIFTKQEQHVVFQNILLSSCCLCVHLASHDISPGPKISLSHRVCCAGGWGKGRKIECWFSGFFPFSKRHCLPGEIINQNKSHGRGWLTRWILHMVSEGRRTEHIIRHLWHLLLLAKWREEQFKHGGCMHWPWGWAEHKKNFEERQNVRSVWSEVSDATGSILLCSLLLVKVYESALWVWPHPLSFVHCNI